MPTPELRREERRKYDRHEAYVYFHLGIALVALGIVLTDVPNTSAVGGLAWETQQLLGGCMLFGSASALAGTLMGTRWLRKDTVEHPLDLRYPYAFGLGGLIGVGISMWSYFVVILLNATLIGALGGGLSFAFGCMAIHLTIRFWHQIAVRTQMRNVLTRRAIRDRDDQQEQMP